MGLAKVFKLSVYGITAFVGAVLGAAERGWIPFLSLPVTIIGYYWCEILVDKNRQPSGLGEAPALVLGFLSLIATATEFFGNNPEGKLLSGIHLVVFLTCVVLLQKKSDYRYWMLMALGVLQIAVGSVLTSGTWFGLCLILYVFGAVWTLSVFSLYRAENAILLTEAALPDRGNTLVGQAFNTVRFEDGTRWVTSRLVGGVVATSMAGLFVAALFYLFIPRVWVGTEFGISDEALPSSLRIKTGLAAEVRLGEMRPILESTDPVIRLRLFDNQTGRPVTVETYSSWLGDDAPSFRAAILTEYQNGRWRSDRSTSTVYTSRLMAKPDDTVAPDVIPTIRQEIRLYRIGNDALVCMGRAVAMHDPEGFRCGLRQPTSEIAVRRDWFKNLPGAVDYIAYSEYPSDRSKRDATFVPGKLEMSAYRITHHLDRCEELPDDLTRLADLARRVVDEESKRVGRILGDIEKARVVLADLRNSGRYQYSLTPPSVEVLVDPIEDFLFNRHAGHCEYFASALALMLRAVDIPARLVSGFKGGDYQDDGYFLVEKRHAHVWVEAWVENQKWLTLDPTPEAARQESVADVGSKRSVWAAVSTQLTGIWESNILEISFERQEYMLYGPMREAALALWERILKIWYSPQASLSDFIVMIWNPQNWLTPLAAIAIVIGLLVVIWKNTNGLQFLGRFARSRRADSRRHRVEFYEQFTKLMRARGHWRLEAQTQGEFVHAIAVGLSQDSNDAVFGEHVLSIGRLFYLVRFGNGELTAAQQHELRQILIRLEQRTDRKVVGRETMIPVESNSERPK